MPITYDDPGTLYDDPTITYDGATLGVPEVFVMSLLQIVDPDDTTDVLFDLNDQIGANSQLYGSVQTWLVTDMDLGVAALKDTGIEDIAKPLAFNRQATAPMRCRIIVRASSYDNLNLAVSTLANHIAEGCVMRWQPTGSGNVRYIDVLPSPTPVLIDGHELSLYDVLQHIDTPNGVTLNLERLAYTRSDRLAATTNIVTNPTPGRDSNGDGTPDGWTILSTPTLSLDATQNSLHVVAGAASRGVQQEQTAGTTASGEVWTAAADFKVASGTAEIRIEWRTAANATISAISQTVTNPGWVRMSVTGTAPATTDHVRLIIQSSGGASTFDTRYIQLEKASAPSPFRVPAQTMLVDPAAAGFTHLLPVYNPADAPSPCEIICTFPDSGSQIVEIDYALISDRNVPGARSLYDLLNGPNYAQCDASTNGWTRTLTGGTVNVVDTTASGGNSAEYSATTTPAKALTLTRTTLLNALRGRFKVYANVNAAVGREWNVQLNWGAGTVAGEANEPKTIDTTDEASRDWGYVDLGDIQLPREKNIAIGQLTLDLYAWMTSGAAASIRFDHLVFVPTDDSAFVTVPGESSIPTVKGKYLTSPPDQLGAPASDPAWIAGEVKSGSMRLNVTNEAAGLGDNTAGIFTGVTNHIHEVTFEVHANHSGSGGITTWRMEIADLTANTVPASITNSVSGGNSLAVVKRVRVTDTNGDVYQPRVVGSTLTGTGHVDVDAITVSDIPYIPQNAKVRSDPGTLPSRSVVEQIDSSSNLGLECDATGVPFWLPPGLSLIYIKCFDVPQPGAELNKWTLGRTMSVTARVTPRFWG